MHPEPFAPPLLDRHSSVRADPRGLQQLWQHPDARRVAVRDGEVVVPAGIGDAEAAASVGLLDADAAADRRVLLGLDPQGRPWWLLLDPPDGPEFAMAGLRTIGPRCGPLQLEVLMTAAALQSWHARHGFCAVCGTATAPAAGGWVRRCPGCGAEHYPRTDPAVIVLVIDELDRALLGRQVRWPAPWRSALAGFVEPGERAESAVRREVAEEVGLRLDRVHYVGSQPWPFPGSLMLGFHAWTSDLDIEPDGEEIAEAHWYSRDQLVAAATSGQVQLPPAISIARTLIEAWFGQPLPGSWLRG